MTTHVFGPSGGRVAHVSVRKLQLQAPCAITFAGQASDYLEELTLLRQSSPRARKLVDTLLAELDAFVRAMPPEDRSFFTEGFAALQWIAPEGVRPTAGYLQSVPVSFPLILVTQLGHYERLREAGLDAVARDLVKVTAGHSQGIMAAVATSLSWTHGDLLQVAKVLAPLGMMFALRMQQAWPARGPKTESVLSAQRAGLEAPSPMAAITGLLPTELRAALKRWGEGIECTLDNTLFRQVISGDPERLEQFRERVFAQSAEQQKARKERRTGGRVPDLQWQYLPVSAPFHSKAMAPAMEHCKRDAERLGFVWSAKDLALPVLDTELGTALSADESLIDRLITVQCVRAVSWRAMCDSLVKFQVKDVLDCGPGDALSKLTFSNLRGTGLNVWALSSEQTLQKLSSEQVRAESNALTYPMPTKSVDQKLGVDNKFTKLTATPPVFLAGMTPTTVEAPIVAAAANAGFFAELAGGGQVTEKILRLRLEELRKTLKPGAGVVFNALYLDPYLWKLHFGGARPLVLRLVDEGYPIVGVTVSAGVPPKEEAVALLRMLDQAGLRRNSFKPGNDRELKEVVAIAQTVSDLPVIVQIEGGHAGGHHSWEDLDDLLLRHYPALRAQSNIVLAAGGGVGTPERAAEYINGKWAVKYGSRPLPVDAVFLGTVAMACLEAKTSLSVKEALVKAKGTDRWIADGTFVEGVTSGRSQLDASVYYLDTTASRVGRLLDEVAGNEANVQQRREEIITALAKTARPYFGDIEAMTYGQLLERLLSLTMVGTGTEYEDGIWPDRSYRTRFLQTLQLAEARLCRSEKPFQSMFDEAQLDEPKAAIERLYGSYPEAQEECVYADDALAFFAICKLPGKPVNFVPRIDADVRRWYKADSLWHAHDERFTADQVLALPGPKALAGIDRVNEPVGDLLRRFADQITAGIELLPAGAAAGSHNAEIIPTELWRAGDDDVAQPGRWYERLDSLGGGPIALTVRALRAIDSDTGLSVLNPLRGLLAPKLGAELTIVRDSTGVVTAVRSVDAEGRVRVVLDGHGAVLHAYGPNNSTGKLNLCLQWDSTNAYLQYNVKAYRLAQRSFYQSMLFGHELKVVKPFDTATATLTVNNPMIQAFAYATGDQPGRLRDCVPLSMAFALLWEPMFSALSGALPDVTRLVHERNETTQFAGWNTLTQSQLKASATIVGLEFTPDGTRVIIEGTLHTDLGLAAEVRSSFFIREALSHRGRQRKEWRTWSRTIAIHDHATLKFLREQPWMKFSHEPTLHAHDSALFTVECTEFSQTDSLAVAKGVLRDAHGSTIATIDCHDNASPKEHPVAVLCALLAPKDNATVWSQPALVAEYAVTAPRAMDAYANASGDRNPLHLDDSIATLAGLSAPIVHGMWTASMVGHQVTQAVRAPAKNLLKFSTSFDAPVLRGQPLRVLVTQRGLREGSYLLSVEVRTDDAEERLVLKGDAEVLAPKTAYVFPGQGIQRQGMGMAGYARSAAARAVWDEADAHSRRALGFSLLKVVRDNPHTLNIRGETFTHPNGVLFLTQFTQVAMVVLAVAQVAELRAEGALVKDAMLAGHSLGEYSALTAIAQVVPLRAAIEIVYARGLTMDRLVDRDATGRSVFEMRVVRPNHAALDDAGLQDIVERCAREGEPIEIVNFNVRGSQYAITGHIAALERLKTAVTERARAHHFEPKKAIAVVPGVDVPFHSTLLRDGVAQFRSTLQCALPKELDATVLVGRYIPNLTGRPFSLDRTELEKIAVYTGSVPLQQMLTHWSGATLHEHARTLLIELLAYQFASPVRWIDTQELLFVDAYIDRLIEIGIAEQPTLTNMAAQSVLALGIEGPRILNSELHAAERLGPPPIQRSVTVAPTTVAPATNGHATPATSATPTANVSAPAPAPAPAPTAQPAAASRGAVGDLPFTARDGLRTLLAVQARMRIEQIKEDETLDELLGGNSAKRNQVLADLGQEFGVGPIDGAHELPLNRLAESLQSKSPSYADFGKYLGATIEQRLTAALAPARLTKADVSKYLADRWAFGVGRTRHILAEMALHSRPGDSTRSGALATVAPGALSDAASGYQWIDSVIASHASAHGVALSPASAAGTAVTAVDAGALRELEQRLLGPEGILVTTAQEVLRAAGQEPVLDTRAFEIDPRDSKLAAVDAEHDESYLTLAAGTFSSEKHLHLSSASEWIRRDISSLFFALMDDKEVDARAHWLERRLDAPARNAARALAARAEKLGRPEVGHRLHQLAASSISEQSLIESHIPLITGAGPGSIAMELVGTLLSAGKTVIVTTSKFSDERCMQFRALYRERARAGAELHVVPLNQGSFTDIDSLVQWLAKAELVPDLVMPFGALSENASLLDVGPRSLATLRIQLLGVQRLIAKLAVILKENNDDADGSCHVVLPLSPNHGLFGGDGLYGESKAALEVLCARWKSEHKQWGRFFTLVGAKIGWVKGTGLMAANDTLSTVLERDAGLKTFTTEEMASALLSYCTSDSRALAMKEPVIADLTAGLANIGDLGGHAAKVRDQAEQERKASAKIEALRSQFALRARDAIAGRALLSPAPKSTPRLQPPSLKALEHLPALDHLSLDHVTVVVGMGEVSPWGNARTRWSAECHEQLSLEALFELSWMMGLIEAGPNGTMVDRESKQLVHYHQLRERYAAKVQEGSGIRLVQGSVAHGFDPANMHRHTEVHVDQEMAFTVPSVEAAERFREADPSHIRVEVIGEGSVRVRCLRGAKVHVGSAASLRRCVVGQVPDGWDPTRYGIPRSMVAQVDRVTLFNLVATVEAFISAGMEPEELYRHLHITRVATTQSSGIGGMQKLRRLYHDGMMDRERQSDVLQETLINVIAGWIVQAYVGSYGPISSPVGACATAALSIAEASDLIATGRADFVVTGGCDDYNEEGAVGFSDMGATADSIEAETKGISARRLSRPNDRRRMGFVEGQGAGALLLCRGSVALRLGLPVYGIIGLAASHSDGINASVPAPGQGLLGVASESVDGAELRANACQFEERRTQCKALESKHAALSAVLGESHAGAYTKQAQLHLAHTFAQNCPAISPLRGALAIFGLTADDIAFVSKHDTSTNANDSNESKLHQRIAQHLGRSKGLPLHVISQKSLTGHSKGAAAAWQMIGALQAMNEGVIPGNRSLEDVAPSLQHSEPLCFSDVNIPTGSTTLRAALVTSLGFGHVGALVCLIHRNFFWKILSESQRDEYLSKVAQRQRWTQLRTRRAIAATQPLYTHRTERPFIDKEHTDAHHEHEAAVLLNADARRDGARFAHVNAHSTVSRNHHK